jgi:hypothetical protein
MLLLDNCLFDNGWSLLNPTMRIRLISGIMDDGMGFVPSHLV